MITAAYTKFGKNAVVPQKATDGAAGHDLCACLEAPVTIPPHGRALIGTGIAVAIPCGYAGFVFGRSGLGAKHGVTPANGVGVIDSDYRGEIFVALANHSEIPYTVTGGDRIAQICVMPVAEANFQFAETLPDTERGSGGFGSTGR